MSVDVPSSRPSNSAAEEPDWTDQVTDLIVDTIDKVRQATTGKALLASRAVVYGLAAIAVLVLLALIGLAFVGRLLHQIPIDTWITYAGLSVLFLVSGALLWKTRHAS